MDTLWLVGLVLGVGVPWTWLLNRVADEQPPERRDYEDGPR